MYEIKKVIIKMPIHAEYLIELTNGQSLSVEFRYLEGIDEWMYYPTSSTKLSLCELKELVKISKALNKKEDKK